MPNVAWVWDMHSVELHSVLIHLSAVKCLSFAPSSHHLIIATGNPRFHLWTPFSASVYELSNDQTMSASPLNTLGITKVKWNARSNKMLLYDKTQAIIAFPGFEFMSLAQPPSEAFMGPSYGGMMMSKDYLGSTASKFLGSV